ncbi:GlxA family transcriptional regulator [Labrys sp. KB_33_2]|uniref:GlxA family transcriptional regulator n=1 Tax=unclassified Labrys (in: a-proteobacteria) TaxID=2688601 RepID=UPI003EBF7B1B
MTMPPSEIGLLAYPDVQLAALYGLADLFAIADRIARERREGSGPLLRVSRWECDDSGQVRNRDGDDSAIPSMIILPPSLAKPPSEAWTADLADFLRRCHGRGSVLASVCVGAFLLAETGLLDGRQATTHWSYAELLAERFGKVRVDSAKIVIDDGDIVTAAGLMSWTDLGLKLVERLLGTSVMVETGRAMLVDPLGREQRHYSVFSPRLNHGDEPILVVQHWLQQAYAGEIDVSAMATKAGLERRTFLRRFGKATGLRPVEYCQQLRVAKARDMLETTRLSFDRIAWNVGYGDPVSFRKIFVRTMGLTPGDYRRRFGAA